MEANTSGVTDSGQQDGEQAMYEADDFLTVEEVMGLFRCTDKHVHNMINAGRLQSIKVGRRRLILRASADDLINSELTKSA